MVSKKKRNTDRDRSVSFSIEGKIQREQSECEPGELKLAAYVFDKAGSLLGQSDIDASGKYSVAVRLSRPADVELVVGPVGEAQQIRHSSAFSKSFTAQEWQGKETQFSLHYDALLPISVWRPWWPQRICVSGHIRKVVTEDGETEFCRVPFVKVEIFDVDREDCFWPLIRKWPELVLDRPVVRIPELIKEPPFPPEPFPGPDPLPELKLSRVSKQLQGIGTSPLSKIAFNPQPEPPRILPLASKTAFKRIGETSQLNTAITTQLDKLTLTSKIAPWHIFPGCFYSKALVCETTTDCNGYFKCCFNWWPFHFRRGRLRYDSRPDIIIKITQIINGVETVIYMDPYTSTRWNVNSTHIDLFLDDEEVVCSHANCYQPPDGSPVFFTRIGDDEVYQISQASGLYNQGGLSNVAYGSRMNIYAQFGDNLTQSDPASGSPPDYFYYRLSYAPQGSSDDAFKFIDVDLNDTRVDKGTLIAQSHKLGPYTVNSVSSLYEVRNFDDFYWYNPDWVGQWKSHLAEEDTGTYVLRLEVFDKNGAHVSSAAGSVDYRNGAGTGNGIPPAPLPAMVDHCDLLITLDNKRPVAELNISGVTNDCGVIPWASVPPFDASVLVSQENNRLRGWILWVTRGVGSEQWLDQHFFNNGLPGSDSKTVSANHLLIGLDSTCAFAFRLRAWAHVRNGRHFIYYDQDIDAVAIEKCPVCPPP